MNKYSDPIEYLLSLCDEATITGKWKLDKFTIRTARDELKRLKDSRTVSVPVVEKAAPIVRKPSAYARVNEWGDLYDLRLQNNPYVDQKIIVPLYK